MVSDIVAHLELKGLVERQDDPDDRRRRLVWLSPIGRDFLQHDQEILSVELLRSAVATMAPADRAALARGMQALLAADARRRERTARAELPTHRKPQRKDRDMTATGTHNCESCGMPSKPAATAPIAPTSRRSAVFRRALRANGRMAGPQAEPEASRADLEASTLAYMSTMPAWRDHPRVTGALAEARRKRWRGQSGGGLAVRRRWHETP